MTIPLPSLGDHNLVLRPYELADFDDFTELVARPELTNHLIEGAMSIREAGHLFHAMTRAYYGSNIEAWAVVLPGSEEYIGHAMLRRRLPEDNPHLSFVLRGQFWARGMPARIVTELLGYAFDVSRHDRVLAMIQSGHLQAARVLEKSGMRPERRGEDSPGGIPVYAMTRQMWQASTEKQSTR